MTISELYELFTRHPAITTDSRNCPAGSIFFALRGERFDGNCFARQALETGCGYAVIDNPDYYVDERTVIVDDALETLQQLACLHRKVIGCPVIAITGTNGKTTTKELAAAVLSSRYNLLYTEGNLNNRIGVPLTLLRLTRSHEMAVIEMGASHPGDIEELVNIARPDYGLITNVGQAHLEGFGSFANIIKTKGELYDYIRHAGGTVFIDADNRILMEEAQGIRPVTYGFAGNAFVSGGIVDCNPFLTFEWRQQGRRYTVETHLIGAYNVKNALAAVALGCHFKIPAECINRSIAAYEPTNNRSQLKKTASNTLFIDAYNANPTSMKEALKNFASFSGSPKAVILGDMLELGPDSDRLHAEIIQILEESDYDRVILCGPHFRQAAGSAFTACPTTDSLIETLRKDPLKGYTILIKGSHSLRLDKVTDLL